MRPNLHTVLYVMYMSTTLTYCVNHVSPGVVSCILLFEKIVPFLCGKNATGLDVPPVQKQKTQ